MLFTVKPHKGSMKDLASFNEAIQKLKEHFSSWTFKDMGELSAIKNSKHYHVQSGDKNETGTLEITFNPEVDGTILKLVKNREGNWAMGALNEVIIFLESL